MGPFNEGGFKNVFGFPLRREEGKGVARVVVATTSGPAGITRNTLAPHYFPPHACANPGIFRHPQVG